MTDSKMMERRTNRIMSLQALRAIGFIGIFLCHVDFPYHWAAIGVSTFFVLSGFLLTVRYLDQDIPLSYTDRLKFAWKRIGKLYPLHIITMCCSIVMNLIVYLRHGASAANILFLLAGIGLNVTLLQSWIPYNRVNTSLNGVAWFLSDILFLYFMFPVVNRWIQKARSRALVLSCILVLVIQLALRALPLSALGIQQSLYDWIVYFSPLFRLGDFFIGCCLGRYYQRMRPKLTTSGGPIMWSIMELLFAAVTILVILWPFRTDSSLLNAVRNTACVPIAAGWVSLFAVNRGILTKVLCNRFFLFLGDISPYAFLIHYVITCFCSRCLGHWDISLSGGAKCCLILFEFLVTILASLLYSKMAKRWQMKKAAGC